MTKVFIYVRNKIMFDTLSERLQEIIKKTRGEASLSEENMTEALREIRRALLEADVSLKVVKSFISKIKDRAEGENVLKSLSPSQQLIGIVYDEIKNLFGKDISLVSTDGNPNIIMLLGLQGSGKTTSCAKLALKLKKEGRVPLMVAADVNRPAAIKQLISLGKQINVDVYAEENNKEVREIVKNAIERARNIGCNSVIVDTAGRLQIDTDLMAELVIIDRFLKPQEKLLVVDAMTGQEAVNVAQTFNEQLDISGVILTKVDGDARGGAALSIAEATGKPIKLTGIGEKLDALEPFYPDRMAQRILGMGDVLTLVEKAQQAFDIEEAKELERKFRKSDFNFEDFLKMQKQMSAFGSLDQLLGMLPIPGVSKDQRELIAHTGEKEFKKTTAIINSMTVKERQNPDIITHSRRVRIAKGSGLPLSEINSFIKNFEKMRKMVKQFNNMSKQMHGKKGKFKMPGGFGNVPKKGFRGF